MEVIEKQILTTFILAKNSQISCRNEVKKRYWYCLVPSPLNMDRTRRSVTEGSARSDGRRKTQLYSDSLPCSNECKTFIM